MASVRGTNALCYIGGTAVPLANEWSLDIEQEKMEAPHSFVCPSLAASAWTERSGGYFSASFSISALYDDSDDSPIDAALGDSELEVILYPACATTTHYWIGDFWLDISHTTNVDDYSTLDISGESDGQVQWAGAGVSASASQSPSASESVSGSASQSPSASESVSGSASESASASASA